jgi:polar amino acid transport system substrate-binding protein
MGRQISMTLAAVSVGLLSLAGPTGAVSADTRWKEIQEEGVIRVGIFNENPFGYVDDEGQLTGVDPEILRIVLERIADEKIEMEAVVADDFGALIPGLLAGRTDIIAAGLYITPPRCKQVNFGLPVTVYGEALLVAPGNPHGLHSYEDVRDNPEIIFGLATGGSEVQYAKAVGVPAERIQEFPNYPTAIEALKSGRIQVVGPPALTAQGIVQSVDDPPFEIAVPFSDPVIDGKPVRSFSSFGFRKEDEDLRDAFNAVLQDFIGSEEHLELISGFGLSEQQVPPKEVTVDSLCAES